MFLFNILDSFAVWLWLVILCGIGEAVFFSRPSGVLLTSEEREFFAVAVSAGVMADVV